MIRLEFEACEDEMTLVGVGETFLTAVSDLLNELSIFINMEQDFWVALAAVAGSETEATGGGISSPETRFVLRRIEESAASRSFEELGERLTARDE